MSNHLTEDQISRWFIGQSTLTEQRHVQGCGPCTAELGRFLDTMESFKVAVSTRADQLTGLASPNLAMVLSGEAIPATPVGVREIWSKNEFRHARWLSLVVHAVVLGLLVIPPAVTTSLRPTETVVTLYRSVPLILSFPRPDQSKSGGGGGGGRKALTPPSKGVPPRGADRQIVPPLVEPKNLMPELVVESTVIAPQLQNLRPIDVQIGDPAGVVGPLSAGPGKNGGVGTGDGTGVGPGRGPGGGDGEGGGVGGGPFVYGAGVGGRRSPVPISKVEPEYSDDARKARIQGAVELRIIVLADGTPRLERVTQALGHGLDQKA